MTFPKLKNLLFSWCLRALCAPGLILAVAATPTARAAETASPFSGAWMRDAYWRDGKAEFNIYEGTVARYGQAQPAEVIHILVREDFAPEAHVKADDWQRPGVYPVLKLNQVLRVQTGLYVYQQMHSNFWRLDGDGLDAGSRLIKWSLTSNDSCGNTFKIADREGERWKYRFDTYWEGMLSGSEDFAAPPDGVFYDELPARVRSIDFEKETGAFTVPLAPTVIHSKKDAVAFAPATVDFATDRGAGQITVNVAHAGGHDVFILDAAAPHLLRVWRPAAGGELRLKQSLKIDYWNYHNLGDKERALHDAASRAR